MVDDPTKLKVRIKKSDKKDQKKKEDKKLENKAAPPAPPKPMAAIKPVKDVLPAEFLGRWSVQGLRSNVKALPEYQAGMDSIFSGSTSNVWTISGSPEQGYMLSTDSGVSTALIVESTGNQAILRYQHPINTTMDREALVMQLGPGGVQFNGLERITIVKKGEDQARAEVTYKLSGKRL